MVRLTPELRDTSFVQAVIEVFGADVRERAREEGREEGALEGRLAQVRHDLLVLGTQKLGAPDTAVLSEIEHLDDLATLERLLRRILTASTLQELLSAEPGR